MTITEKKDGSRLILELEGRLDAQTSAQLDETLKNLAAGIDELIIDFSKIEYISSAGLRVLLAAHKQMTKNGRLIIRNANETVMEIFDMTGFVDIITIENK